MMFAILPWLALAGVRLFSEPIPLESPTPNGGEPMARLLTNRATEPMRAEEYDDVIRWREETLRSAGYFSLNALTLARADVDLHVACDLLKRGCQQRVAMRILL